VSAGTRRRERRDRPAVSGFEMFSLAGDAAVTQLAGDQLRRCRPDLEVGHRAPAQAEAEARTKSTDAGT
jgi:hypothetical protein